MKHTNTVTVQEQVSALADGHLSGEEFALLVDRVCSESQLRATWQTYHVVGDVLRSGGHRVCSDTSGFVSRLQQRLALEPAAPVTIAQPAKPIPQHIEAANEPVFRWKLVAGAASLAAAAAIGWNWIGGPSDGPVGAQLAQQQSSSVLAASHSSQDAPPALAPMRVVVGNGGPQVMLRDARLDQLLEAHQQVGGASQMPSSFLRNATFDGPSR
ncbi:MAG: sigma-E factor negative regulatory protein [Variovorax sp.]